jgi:hypothetical protein
MTCREVQSLSGNYLDGELPEELCDSVQRHLLRCGTCREDVDSLRMTLEVLSRAQNPPRASEAFLAGALEALAEGLELPRLETGAPGQLVLHIRE